MSKKVRKYGSLPTGARSTNEKQVVDDVDEHYNTV